jgi:hypothetical protein
MSIIELKVGEVDGIPGAGVFQNLLTRKRYVRGCGRNPDDCEPTSFDGQGGLDGKVGVYCPETTGPELCGQEPRVKPSSTCRFRR